MSTSRPAGASRTTTRVALVTGAASGIGLATAEQLMMDGASVVLADRASSVEAVASELAGRTGGRAAGIQVDLSREEDVLRLASEAAAPFGPIDILVNNAGVHPKKEDGKYFLEDTDSAHWASVMAINLTAPFLLTRELLRGMKARSWGRVINVSSCSARAIFPATSAVYVASKHGLIGLTQMSAHEAAPFGVTVNAIAPGPVQTGLTVSSEERRAEMARLVPIGRFGAPMELAAAVAFLASEAASFITGAVLDVNGGSAMV